MKKIIIVALLIGLLLPGASNAASIQEQYVSILQSYQRLLADFEDFVKNGATKTVEAVRPVFTGGGGARVYNVPYVAPVEIVQETATVTEPVAEETTNEESVTEPAETTTEAEALPEEPAEEAAVSEPVIEEPVATTTEETATTTEEIIVTEDATSTEPVTEPTEPAGEPIDPIVIDEPAEVTEPIIEPVVEEQPAEEPIVEEQAPIEEPAPEVPAEPIVE